MDADIYPWTRREWRGRRREAAAVRKERKIGAGGGFEGVELRRSLESDGNFRLVLFSLFSPSSRLPSPSHSLSACSFASLSREFALSSSPGPWIEALKRVFRVFFSFFPPGSREKEGEGERVIKRGNRRKKLVEKGGNSPILCVF